MNRLLATALATVLIVGSGSSAQSGERPFQGESSGFYTENARGYDVFGHATHLGQFYSTLPVPRGFSPQSFFRRWLDIFRDEPALRSSLTVFVAADGSTLEGSIRYDTFDAATLTATAAITITGGTGRFAEAAGAIDVLLLFTSEALLECDVLLHGTLDY